MFQGSIDEKVLELWGGEFCFGQFWKILEDAETNKRFFKDGKISKKDDKKKSFNSQKRIQKSERFKKDGKISDDQSVFFWVRASQEKIKRSNCLEKMDFGKRMKKKEKGKVLLLT